MGRCSLLTIPRAGCFVILPIIDSLVTNCTAFWKEELECFLILGEGAKTVHRLSGG